MFFVLSLWERVGVRVWTATTTLLFLLVLRFAPSPLAPLPAGEGNSEPSLLHELTARATERRRHRRLEREAVNDQSVHNVAPNQHQHGDCIFVADRLDH